MVSLFWNPNKKVIFYLTYHKRNQEWQSLRASKMAIITRVKNGNHYAQKVYS